MAKREDLYKWLFIENIVTIIGAILLVIFLVWFTKSLLGLWGLLLLLNLNTIKKPKKTDVTCPACGLKFNLSNNSDK